ncbi:RNA methyltransferase [Planctomycetota bacterium]|nr:RNA methyltransferase [Planctomycetota bacterium]
MAIELVEIDDVGDERLRVFGDVLKRRGGEDDMCARFVVEGVEPVKRLMRNGDRFEIEAVLCEKGRAAKFCHEVDGVFGGTVYCVDRVIFDAVCGYPFTRGVMACGRMVKKYEVTDLVGEGCVLVCEHCENEENLGVMIRTAAALGVKGVLLGERGVSPFARRVVRVSMGNVFGLPMVRTNDLVGELQGFQAKGMCVVGAALMEDAVSVDAFEVERGGVALVMGNEPAGLSDEVLEVCDAKVVIPVRAEADSLNVSVAAGILMWKMVGHASG